MEEQFLFLYHLRRSREEFMSYPVLERQWLIERFVKQKEMEHEAAEKARKKKN